MSFFSRVQRQQSDESDASSDASRQSVDASSDSSESTDDGDAPPYDGDDPWTSETPLHTEKLDKVCVECRKSFSRRDSLKRHISSKCGRNTGEYSCGECAKSYNRKDVLDRHIATTHDKHRMDWKWDCDVDKTDIKLRLPANVIVAGATQSGKTTTVAKLLTSSRGYFEPAPRRVILLYNCDQPLYQEMMETLSNRGVQVKMMKSRELTENDMKAISTPDFETVVLIDDSTISVQRSMNLAHLFTQGRHNHVSFIVFLHSIFGGNDANRIMSQNTLYYFLQNAPRMRGQISNLGSQIGMRKELQHAFDCISATPYSHVFVDLHPKTPISHRLVANIVD